MPVHRSKPLIEVKGLKLKTPMGIVYEDVTFQVGKGQVCALFGGAGSGKTALLLTICGRMKESAGSAYVAGLDLRRDYRVVRRNSAISFIAGLNDVQPFLRVKNILAAELSLVGKRGNKATTDAYLEKWNFADKADVRFDDLSSYDAAYFGIMLACTADPKLLCVDDVQTNLTQYQSIKLMNVLKKISQVTQTTIFVACSEYEIARYADGIVVMGQEAEAQRLAVIRDKGPRYEMPVFGSGNGAKLGSLGAYEGEQKMREPALREGSVR